MSFDRADGILAKLVDDLEISGESVGVLVVFGGDIGFDGVGQE